MKNSNTKHIIILITSLILTFSFIKIEFINFNHYNLDKLVHALAYFTLSFTVFQSQKRYIAWIALIVFSISVGIEVLQKLYGHGRQFSAYDILANGIGIVVACTVYKLLLLKKKI